MSMDYGDSDSSGTDDDLPPSHTSRMQREERDFGNSRAVVQKTQYGRPQNDMESQIHWLEQDAYSAVLRAFKAQADAITWAKEGLMSELRKELRVSDEEHRDLIGKVNADDVLRQIREWRQSGSNQLRFITNAVSAPGATPSPTVSASQKKQKISNVMSKLHLQSQQPNVHNSPVPSSSGPFATWKDGESAGVRGKKSKGHPQANALQLVKATQLSAQEQKRPPGRPPGKSRTTAIPNTDPLLGRKVMTRWPQDNNFYEAVITTYSVEHGKHVLVYDINTPDETYELVDLKDISPSDIRWDGPVPEGFARGGIKKSAGSGVMTLHNGSVRGVLKGQATMDPRPSQNGTGGRGVRFIELRQTDKLIKEVERVFTANYSDPVDVERAKNLLKEQELSLIDAIQRLSEVSDEDGRNPPSSRTHSADHVRMWSRQNSRNEHGSGDEYDTAEDGRGEDSDGEPFVGEYGAASDEMQDGDEYG